MKRTTIFLDESLERDLQAISRQQSRPMASVVREALAVYVASQAATDKPALSFVATGASGRGDVAERHEDLLWRYPRKPARRGSARKAPSTSKRR